MKRHSRITSDLQRFLYSNKARLWLLVMTIILFLLAAGAPGAIGGGGH
jgi:hypothetical protein